MTQSAEKPQVFLADDHAEMRRMVAMVLRLQGFEVHAVADGQALVDACRAAKRVDAIVTDVRMPVLSGLEALAHIAAATPQADPVRVVVTAFGDPATHAAAARLGATCLDKPFDPDDLAQLIKDQLAEA